MKTQNKNSHLKLLLTLLCFLYAQFSYSEGLIRVDKLAVEKQIYSKIENALSVLIEKKQYILDINVQTQEVDNSAKKTKKLENYNFSDAKEAKKDYFLFHKLGIEAPINGPSAEEIAEEKEKSKLPKVFDVISSVKISILLDELLDEEVTNNVETVLKKLSFNVPVKPSMDFSRVQFKKKVVEEVKKEKTFQDFSLAELLNLGAKYSTSIGFLVTGLFLSLVSFILFIMYSKLQKGQTSALIDSNKEIAAMAAESASASSDSSDEDESSTTETIESTTETKVSSGLSDETMVASAVARFEKYFTDNKQEAATLLKKWINLKAPGSKEGLILITQELDSEVLQQTFETLNNQDRKLWRNVISSASGEVNLQVGARFIDEQILEEVIVPTDLISDETKQLLYSLDVDTFTNLVIENPEFGPLLMNTLSSSFIVKIIPRLDSSLIETLTINSVKADNEELKKQEPLLQEKLKAYHKPDLASPFSDKIMEILPYVDIESEEYFFTAFGKNGDTKKMKEVLSSFLPAKSIYDLPETSMKIILTKMKQSSLVEFLVVTDENISSKLIEMIAPEGSKKREVLDLELSNMQTDEIKLAKLKKNKSDVESKFIAFSRKLINKNAQIQEEISPIIDELCLKYVEEDHSNVQAA
ncbi:hypothetical protein [Halobacteriovorax sp.]|uniref:hypothetical protein n=1 Tax=Halobacteriovorax sp. TaxID=2020862 RepID=UPI00356350C9